jgi:redox-sensitive bicupin YhaK (pirin superfamily)
MIGYRLSDERGVGAHGWLDSRHTFSFARYIDREHMGFRDLRVINDDRIEPARGFGTHGHENMEIFSWVVEGSLAHRDSMGNEKVVTPGMLQYMSAGAGVTHSEYNASKTDRVHLYQIWIIPREQDTEPRYEDRDFSEALAGGGWVELLSPDGEGGGVRMVSDARVYAARAKGGDELSRDLKEGRGAWLQVIKGAVTVGGKRLTAGDAAFAEDETQFQVKVEEDAEVLFFDLP